MNQGEIIVVHGFEANGHNEQPGIVTMVWSTKAAGNEPGCGAVAICNVKVFPDCGPPTDITSVNVFSSEGHAINDCKDKIFCYVKGKYEGTD